MNTSVVFEDLAALIGEFSGSGMTTLHLRSGDVEILLSMDSHAGSLQGRAIGVPGPSFAPPTPSPGDAVAPSTPQPCADADAAIPDGATVVTAPTLGTFYRAPKPGAAAYVEIGSEVAADTELCLIEVMKLFTAVRADRRGRVRAVLAADGAMVEAGQPLFALVDA